MSAAPTVLSDDGEPEVASAMSTCGVAVSSVAAGAGRGGRVLPVGGGAAGNPMLSGVGNFCGASEVSESGSALEVTSIGGSVQWLVEPGPGLLPPPAEPGVKGASRECDSSAIELVPWSRNMACTSLMGRPLSWSK